MVYEHFLLVFAWFSYRNTDESEVRFTELSCNIVSDVTSIYSIAKGS